MSLQTRISDLITRLGTEFKAIRILISGTGTGDVSGLNTTANNLVGGINEVKAYAEALINDTGPTAVNTYSSNKITADIAAAVASLIDAAPTTLDTLNELAASLADDPNFATTVTNALALKADKTEIYTRTELGDPETDLVVQLNAALA